MQTSGGWDRIPTLLFLLIVIAAVVLLIAGYGVAVGVGALAGLVLGAIAGSLGSLWLWRGSGRSISFGTQHWSSEDPTSELMAEMRGLGELESIDLGPIRQVTPVLATSEAQGLVVQLLTVEHRVAGLVLTLEARATPGALPPAAFARVVVSDDSGTAYRAAGQGQGGGQGQVRYLIRVLPAPPATATRLMVRVDRFVDLFPRGRESEGPWTFEVPLAPSGAHLEP